MEQSIAFRNQVYQHCKQVLQARVEQLVVALENAREAIWEDTKSSAGDKYETSRERLQQDVLGMETQLRETRKMQYLLDTFKVPPAHKSIQAGHFIQTDNLHVFLGIGLGWIQVEGQRIMALSPASPLGQALLGKQEGDTLLINGQEHTIVQIV